MHVSRLAAPGWREPWTVARVVRPTVCMSFSKASATVTADDGRAFAYGVAVEYFEASSESRLAADGRSCPALRLAGA